MSNTNISALSGIHYDGAAYLPRENKTDEAALATSSTSCNDAELGYVTTHGDDTSSPPEITPQTTIGTTKSKYTEERESDHPLQMEIWQSGDEHDFRYFQLPDRARSHLLKYGSLGREMILRALLETETSVQIYFGYRRALVAVFWPVGIYRDVTSDSDDEMPNYAWELKEYRWKSEEGREVVRQEIDDYLEDTCDGGTIYVDTFFNDIDDISQNQMNDLDGK